MQLAVFTYVKAMEELDLKSRIDAWKNSAGFPVMQTFPLSIFFHLSTCHIESSPYEQAKSNPANLRTSRGRSYLSLFDARFLLAVDCGAFGVEVDTSKFSHESFWMWRVSKSTVMRWRDSGIRLLVISLIKLDDEKVGSKNVR